MLPVEIQARKREDHAEAIRFAIAGRRFGWQLTAASSRARADDSAGI